MAGGANPHRWIERRALVGTAKARASAKTKISKKGKSKTSTPLSSYPKCALTTPISSYTVKGFCSRNSDTSGTEVPFAEGSYCDTVRWQQQPNFFLPFFRIYRALADSLRR